MLEEIFETPQPTEPKSTNRPNALLVVILGLGLLAGAACAGYWYGIQQAQPTPMRTSPSEIPSSTQQPKSLEQPPSGVALVEDNILKVFSINGTQVKSVALEGSIIQGYLHKMEVSPDGQKIAFFGLPEGLVGYNSRGGAAIPLDIFIYDVTSDQFTRITNCTESDPDAVGRGDVDLCYHNFDWGSDSDTYAYTYKRKNPGADYVGVGSISTGEKGEIYSPGSLSQFSPSGQKLFISDLSEARSFYLVDTHGALIKKFSVGDFPVPPEVAREKIRNIYPIWGREDNKAFLIVYEEKENQTFPMDRNYDVSVYAFNPNDERLKLTRIAPTDKKIDYSTTFMVDSITGNIVVQDFLGGLEHLSKNIFVFNDNGDLIAQDITAPTGSEKVTAYGIHGGFVLVGADNGLWIISLGDETPVKISDRPYAKGYFIP